MGESQAAGSVQLGPAAARGTWAPHASPVPVTGSEKRYLSFSSLRVSMKRTILSIMGWDWLWVGRPTVGKTGGGP